VGLCARRRGAHHRTRHRRWQFRRRPKEGRSLVLPIRPPTLVARLVTQWVARTPKSVLAENFRVAPEVFRAIPEKEKYIFQGSNPDSIEKEIPSSSPGYKKSKLQFTHKMLDQEPTNTTGGQVRITDSTNFPLSKTVAAAHLTIQPGALREMHWHRKFFVKFTLHNTKTLTLPSQRR
jgi:hypothetical protein